jgi:hypothetical protein
MTFEIEQVDQDLSVDQTTEVVEQQTEPQISPTEKAARDAGWRPKEEFSGDEASWVDAGEFLRRGELFAKISSQNKEVKELRKAIEDIKKHNQSIRESAYKQALQTLREQRAEAIELGDKAAYLQAETQEEQLKNAWKEEQKEQKEPEAKSNGSDIFQAFLAMNPWYVDDADKRSYADTVGAAYAEKNGISIPHATPEEQIKILKHVSRRVEEEYGKSKPTPKVESGQGNVQTPQKTNPLAKVEASLTDEDRRAMNRFIKLGVLTKEEFLKDYASRN